jgi:SOS-response transcriptional repressor LexA
MVEVGIFDGDYVVINKTKMARPGDMFWRK